MSIQSLGLRAYTNALQNFAQAEQKARNNEIGPSKQIVNDFQQVLNNSLEKVNTLQSDRSDMIQSFASGENQNVHELMIAMQKASLAMNMTSAVRGKVIEAYRELTKMQF